jgi:DNA-binding protein HU-beta
MPRQTRVNQAFGGIAGHGTPEKMGSRRIFTLYSPALFGYDEAANISAQSCLGSSQGPAGVGESSLGKGVSMAEVKRMTQTQFVKKIADTCGIANKVAKQVLETYAAIAVAETKKNGVFVLPGLGRLVRVERKARMGRNPATGAAIKIPAKKVVKFRVAKAVKDAIVPPKKK